MRLWWASLTTEHFAFDAFGSTQEEANEALVRGLDRHAHEYRLPPKWWEAYDMWVGSIDTPGCMRDRELVA